MREALPNAFLFGLTGTPINRRDRNTFMWFGSPEDEGGYLSRYTMQDSIRDGATLPLHFEPRLSEIHIDEEAINAAFAELAERNELSEAEKITLSRKAASIEVLIKAPERVRQIAADIAEHFTSKVEPQGSRRRSSSTTSRRAWPTRRSWTVPAGRGIDDRHDQGPRDPHGLAQWTPDRDELERITARFNDPADPLKIIIVTAKLLTGFDAPILYAQYLDKPLKEHTLLQAITRTNRVYPAEQDARAGRRLPRRLRRRREGVQVRREERPAGHHQHRRAAKQLARPSRRRWRSSPAWTAPSAATRGLSRPRPRSPTTPPRTPSGSPTASCRSSGRRSAPTRSCRLPGRLPLADRRVRVGATRPTSPAGWSGTPSAPKPWT